MDEETKSIIRRMTGLPPRVLCVSLWGRWAAAVAAGVKTIETRIWMLRQAPCWVAIHAAKQFDGQILGRVEPFPAVIPNVEPGCLCALVWVAKCRRLEPNDTQQALVYRPGLFAWELTELRRLRPVPMRGTQKLTSIDRQVIVDALEDPASLPHEDSGLFGLAP